MHKIESLRKAAGLSQEDLANLVGVTQGAVSQWESGESFPRAKLLIQISKILSCTVDDLLEKE
jgi:transcriptional regulator with XRE-family HTH domain